MAKGSECKMTHTVLIYTASPERPFVLKSLCEMFKRECSELRWPGRTVYGNVWMSVS
jgi:hypothetical protein